MVRAESSSIVRLSTRDIAPVDRLNYASWILSSSLAPSALSTRTPAEYELEVAALELPSIAIVAQNGSPQRSVRSQAEIRRTSQRYCFLVLVLAGSWHVTSVTRSRFGAGDLIFYDSRDPLDNDLLLPWSAFNLQLSEQFVRKYADVYAGDERWHALEIPEGDRFDWPASSTYIRRPTFLTGIPADPPAIADVEHARVLALLGDSVTTDHISPAGSIKKESPAGRYLIESGVEPRDFNSYGARRGNHEVMVRGTFANIRLKNLLVPGVEGGVTVHLPSGTQMSIYDAAERYRADGTALIVIAGKEYGTGSSRDWAAKGPRLLGVRAVLAESYERIHRSNLIGMGVVPLQFAEGFTYHSIGLSGRETYDIIGLQDAVRAESAPKRVVTVRATAPGTAPIEFTAFARLDTPQEREYYRHGGILHFVLRQLLGQGTTN